MRDSERFECVAERGPRCQDAIVLVKADFIAGLEQVPNVGVDKERPGRHGNTRDVNRNKYAADDQDPKVDALRLRSSSF